MKNILVSVLCLSALGILASSATEVQKPTQEDYRAVFLKTGAEFSKTFCPEETGMRFAGIRISLDVGSIKAGDPVDIVGWNWTCYYDDPKSPGSGIVTNFLG